MDTAKTTLSVEKPLTSVMEDYLEAIFDLNNEKRVVRVKDIAKKLDVKMPTVTSMLKTLSKRGLVHYDKSENVGLAEKGSIVSGEMHRRHKILRRFLIDILNVGLKTSDEEAYKMEHSLSAGTLNSVTDFMAIIQVCPRFGDNWLERFEAYRREERSSDRCVKQSEQFSCEFMDRTTSMKPGRSSQKEDAEKPL